MGFTDSSVERYLKAMVPNRDAVLARIEAVAARESIPIVGPVVGQLFEQWARMIGAKRVFEMGSAVGYSTIWWARAVGPEGKVYYSDGSAENTKRAKAYLDKAGLLDRVELGTGNALELIAGTEGEFDIVFNDVDKQDYPDVYRVAADRVRVGGLFVADNVLWGGSVADPTEASRSTEAIREFNRLMYADPRYLTTILPVRDGVLLAWRVA
jgi:predicted O-methyltransferase YrrM